jgi:peptide/nickel transport system substrate-binding protein
VSIFVVWRQALGRNPVVIGRVRRLRISALFLAAACAIGLGFSPGNMPGVALGTATNPSNLVIGLTQEPDTLNPLLAQTAAAQEVDSAIFDGLLRVDSQNKLQPALARSWSHSSDGKTWTFHLRTGVHWADGKTFTSADVAWTYKTISNPANPVAIPPGWDLMDSLTTPDPDTVIVHVTQVSAPWLLQVGTTAILPQHLQENQKAPALAAFNKTPLGTGPYRVSEWTPGKEIVLTANPRSWQGVPRITTLTFRLYPDDTALLAAAKAGVVQIAPINPAQAGYAQQVGLHVIDAPSMTWYHVDLKQEGPLRTLAVRQALDYATPRDDILRTVMFGHGRTSFADIAPALAPYYDAALRPRAYLPSQAAALLKSAGYQPDHKGVLRLCTPATQKRPCPALALTLWNVQGDSIGLAINRLLAKAWAAIGVQVTVRQEAASTLFGAKGPQFTHDTTGITYAWTNGDDPDDTFYWNSSSIPKFPSATSGNDIAYFNRFSFQSTIDKLTTLGASTLDAKKRQAIYEQIQMLLLQQVPDIFLFWQDQLWVAPTALHGFSPNPFTSVLWNAAAWR